MTMIGHLVLKELPMLLMVLFTRSGVSERLLIIPGSHGPLRTVVGRLPTHMTYQLPTMFPHVILSTGRSMVQWMANPGICWMREITLHGCIDTKRNDLQ